MEQLPAVRSACSGRVDNEKEPSPYSHPNIWDSSFVESLKTPYCESLYRERAQTLVCEVRAIFQSMGDGEISPSAYDTAWVARIPAIHDSATPRYPQTLEWLLKNQLPDGSWGLHSHFLLSDRLLNTLASVITLIIWKAGEHQVKQGLEFMSKHALVLNPEDGLIAADFDILFGALLKEAELLKLSLPYDLPSFQFIQRKRETRISGVSADLLPPSLASCLEGLRDRIVGDEEWKEIITKYQSKADGSFFNSPASTACVVLETGDEKCLAFLDDVLHNFGFCCVPSRYPVDIFERLWAVDTVETLGIGRHFEKEKEEALDYVYRWSLLHRYEKFKIVCIRNKFGLSTGIGARKALDALEKLQLQILKSRLWDFDTFACMAIPYPQNFKDGNGVFVCVDTQERKQITSMMNLYRASHIAYPGETIMDEALAFTTAYLEKALKKIDSFDVAGLKNNLALEIEYLLKYPWQRNLPRLEARHYIDIFRGEDALLAKTLYQMPYVKNNKYLELAKLDFNIVQSLQQTEVKHIFRWWNDLGLIREFTFARDRPLESYYYISLGTFEPEFSACRTACARVTCIAAVVDDFYDTYGSLEEANIFTEAVKRWDPSVLDRHPSYLKALFMSVYNTVNELGSRALQEQGRDVLSILRSTWERFCGAYLQEAKWKAAKYVPALDEYLENGNSSSGLHMLSANSIFLMGEYLSDRILQELGPRSKLVTLVNLIGRLLNDVAGYEDEKDRGELASSIECYVKDNPGSNEENAIAYLKNFKNGSWKELNREFLTVGNAPPRCKKMIFELARLMEVMYKDRDGYNLATMETKDNIMMTLIEPVPM